MTELEEPFEEDELAGQMEEPTPSGFDRNSGQVARRVLEKLLPDEEIRLEVLSFFARAISTAHEQGEAKWGVTLYPSAVALNVSGFYACWIRTADFFVAFMEASLAPGLQTELENKARWNGTFKRLLGSRIIYVPYSEASKILPQMVTPTEAFIVFTGTRYGRMGARVEGAHSPGVLDYLQGYLEIDLPKPAYASEEETESEEPEGETIMRTDRPTFWKIAPGENGFLWDQCREQGCILIGWPKIGDVRSYPDKEALAVANAEFNHKKTATTIQWRFAYNMKPGDIVVANKGNSQAIGVGVITSDYLPPSSPGNPSTNRDYPNARRVDWRITNPVTLPRAFFGQIPRTLQWIFSSRWQAIRAAYLEQYPGDDALREALDALETHVVTETEETPSLLPAPEAVKPLLQMAERTRNILLYGPPGTGKTWLVTQFAKAFTEPNKVEMVTFHQSFAYEEFVEGIKPRNDEKGQIFYRVEPGVFKSICQRALADPDGKYLLVIDEINRANIAKVLGELITLIEDDKRLGGDNTLQVRLPYSGDVFGVPKNLTILGTMNTADRSIALLDLALRRRFTFVEMPPDPTLLSADVAGVNLQNLLARLNRRIAALLDPDHQIGHSYLMGIETEADLHFAWHHRVLPLLQEYFHHDGERMQAVVGAFVQEVVLDAGTRAALGAVYEDVPRYEVTRLAGDEFRKALQKIAE